MFLVSVYSIKILKESLKLCSHPYLEVLKFVYAVYGFMQTSLFVIIICSSKEKSSVVEC